MYGPKKKPVTFRKTVSGEIIALFPEGDHFARPCLTYQGGRLFEADYSTTLLKTLPCKAEEYESVLKELREQNIEVRILSERKK